MKPLIKVHKNACSVVVGTYPILVDQPYDDCIDFVYGYLEGIRKKVLSELKITYDTSVSTSTMFKEGIDYGFSQHITVTTVLNEVHLYVGSIHLTSVCFDKNTPWLEIAEALIYYIIFK